MLKLTPERMRRVRNVVLNAAFGLLVFAVALTVWFPYGRAKEVAISMAAAQDFDVDIESAGPVFGLGVAFKNIRVSTRPLTGKPMRFIVDAARVKVSPWSLLSSTRSFSVSMDAFGGRIDLDQKGYPNKKGPFYEEIRIRDVNLKEIPGIREAINIPVTGTLRADLEISSTTGRYSDASGSLTFACDACVVGDGKTPLKVEGNPFLAGGLTLPRVRLGEMGGHVKIEKGTAKLQGVEAKSPDGELVLEGEVTLRDPLAVSGVNAYLRFRLTEGFLKTAENLRTILQMAGAAGKRPDGFYGLRLSGTLGRLSPPVLTTVSPFGASLPAARPVGRPGITPSFPQSMTASPRMPVPTPTLPPPPPPAPAEAPPPPPPPPPAAAEPPPPPPPPPPAPEPVPGAGNEPPSQLRGMPPGAAAEAPPPPAPATPPPGPPQAGEEE